MYIMLENYHLEPNLAIVAGEFNSGPISAERSVPPADPICLGFNYSAANREKPKP